VSGRLPTDFGAAGAGRMTLRLITADPPADADQQALRDRLDTWNIQVTGHNDWQPVAIFLRDESGSIRGGVLGDIWAGWLHIKFLWVDEDCRRAGWGSRLLEAAERYARERGCTDAHLDTFSFQAGPRFYEPRGYRVFGVLPDYPHGQAHYFLHKRLAPAADASSS
jgi:GNAT superfamily N-acetyltransferase